MVIYLVSTISTFRPISLPAYRRISVILYGVYILLQQIDIIRINKSLIWVIQFQSSRISWTLLLASTKAKLKPNGDKDPLVLSHCETVMQQINVYVYELYQSTRYFTYTHPNLCFLGIPNSINSISLSLCYLTMLKSYANISLSQLLHIKNLFYKLEVHIVFT
jgi:hypothetical protein